MKKRLFILLLICIPGVGCDQLSKEWARKELPVTHMNSYFADTLRLGYTENTGSFLSLGAHWSPEVRYWVFLVATGLLLLGVLGYLIFNKKLGKAEVIGLSLIVAGGIGNLYDRATNQGGVVDFLNVGVGSLRTGVFNVADMLIMAALLFFLWPLLKEKAQKKELSANETHSE